VILNPDEVHVWYVFSDRVTEPGLLQRFAGTLGLDEAARRDRFVFDRDRHQFLVTHGVLRTLVSDYLGTSPSDCSFTTNRYGRPSLTNLPAGIALDFNLSHTSGLIAFALAIEREIGIDVEDIERGRVDDGLPDRFFSPAEAAALAALPSSERHSRFFDYWTLKEAYIKARGMGLSLPLDGFSFHLDPHDAPRISFAASIDDDPASWQFVQRRPSPRYRLAVAVRRRGNDVPVRVEEFTPA
jgi:4'-phosphopantetheinyl transferase